MDRTRLEGCFGIIGAMDIEVALLQEAVEGPEHIDAGIADIVVGRIGGTRVAIAECGVGKVNAAACAQALADRGVACVVNTGVAGALDDRLKIGDYVVASSCVQHDVDLCRFGYDPGQVAPSLPAAFPADEALSARLLEAVQRNTGATVLAGRIASGDAFVSSLDQRQRIRLVFDALCCEMEAAAIAQVCYRNRLPFAVLRAMSDKADGAQPESYPDFERSCSYASARVVRAMLDDRQE